MLSPDTQGSLFPAEIDENPVLQLKLQERLDTQCDDDLQDTIHSFFKSHLIAPSPVALDENCSLGRTRNLLPRTSSLVPHATPKARRKPSCYVDPNAVVLTEAAVQTALSIPFNFDLEAALKGALADCLSDPPNSSDAFSMLDSAENPKSDASFGLSVSQVPSKSTVDRPSFTACTVRRPVESDPTGYYFLCGSCRKPHAASYYGRRSLFSESSLTPDETINRHDGELPGQRTLVPIESRTTQSINFVYLSSSMVEGNDCCDEQGVEDSDVSTSLLIDTGSGNLVPSAGWGDQCDALSSTRSRDPDLAIGDDLRSRRHSEELPSTPLTSHVHRHRQQSADYESPGPDEWARKQTLHTSKFGQRRLSLPSPCNYREDMRMDSPNLSPILPASRASPALGYPSNSHTANGTELRVSDPSFMDET